MAQNNRLRTIGSEQWAQNNMVQNDMVQNNRTQNNRFRTSDSEHQVHFPAFFLL